MLNTIVAEAFKQAADQLEKAEDFDMAVHDMIKELSQSTEELYSVETAIPDEWVEEAERRPAESEIRIDSVFCPDYGKSGASFEKFSVYTKAELESRAEINMNLCQDNQY